MKQQTGPALDQANRQLEPANRTNGWAGIIQDWLYPPTCLLCGDPGADGRDLCAPCAASLPRVGVSCPRCALPLTAAAPALCGACLQRLPAYDAAFALFRYDEPVRHLVQTLKFGARYPVARLLGNLLADALDGRDERPDTILPVPLHARRYRERGFNQALEIARTVSRRLEIPLDIQTCHRSRATEAQAKLTAVERRRNLRRAFTASEGLQGRRLAVLDDVVTTGTTVNELAKVLRRAGAEHIEVWACARAGH